MKNAAAGTAAYCFGGRVKESGEYTRDSIRRAIGAALGRRLKDEKTIAQLAERGMISPREKLTVGDAIARLRLLTELDDPSPAGFEKLVRELDGTDEAVSGAETVGISIDAPPDFCL